jgi:hypothetical protein
MSAAEKRWLQRQDTVGQGLFIRSFRLRRADLHQVARPTYELNIAPNTTIMVYLTW